MKTTEKTITHIFEEFLADQKPRISHKTYQKYEGIIGDVHGFKCIDTFCHGGGWLTTLEVEPGGRVWQANEKGELRG